MTAEMARTGFTIWAPRGQDNPDSAREDRMLEEDCAARYGGVKLTTARGPGFRLVLPLIFLTLEIAIGPGRGAKFARKIVAICL